MSHQVRTLLPNRVSVSLNKPTRNSISNRTLPVATLKFYTGKANPTHSCQRVENEEKIWTTGSNYFQFSPWTSVATWLERDHANELQTYDLQRSQHVTCHELFCISVQAIAKLRRERGAPMPAFKFYKHRLIRSDSFTPMDRTTPVSSGTIDNIQGWPKATTMGKTQATASLLSRDP